MLLFDEFIFFYFEKRKIRIPIGHLLDYYNNHCPILLQIWVQSPHNASGYYTIYGDDSSYQDHFNARLVTGNTGELYARTGYLGFLRRTEAIGSDGGKWPKTAKNRQIC